MGKASVRKYEAVSVGYDAGGWSYTFKAPIREGNLLTLDNFSTYRDGKPIGHETFCWVDTESMEYSMIN